MEKKLINNLKLKILSVFIAFFVWLAVVNISNPDITGTQNVPLEVLNESVLTSSGKTYELLDDKNTVTVSYKVRTLDSGSVSASDFRAYIDLADMYEPTGAVKNGGKDQPCGFRDRQAGGDPGKDRGSAAETI